MDEGITRGIDVQLNNIDDTQLHSYISLIRSQSCPTCGDTSQQLNAALSGTVISIIIFIHYKKAFSIGCPACLKKTNQAATLKTALLGWWGLPWGLIRTPEALIKNIRTSKRLNTNEASDILVDFVRNNAGIIESIKNNDQSLQVMLTNVNNKQHYNK
ncbi:hypothetical protein [Mucilaginibacter sp. NFX135]|uniref:hypothetical protein n=1 Tax=Mucilaginibacter sp. NFX135 TaxID=3402687 RepID=UPI003AFA5BDB